MVSFGKTAKIPQLEMMQLGIKKDGDQENLETPRGENLSYRRQEQKELMVHEQIEAGKIENIFEM